MEERINLLIDYGLIDDAILLAEEENNIRQDEKWLLLIAKALFQKRLFYRSLCCLNSCSSPKSKILKARCYSELDQTEDAITILESVYDESIRDGMFLKILGDLYLKQNKLDLAKSTYLESYRKDPLLLSVRSALHHLGVDIEEKEKVPQDQPLMKIVHTIGIADYKTQHHIQPPIFPSPLSLYYQFIYNHDISMYRQAESHYSTLCDYLPWWREGIDRYSSILFILKKQMRLAALHKETTLYEPSLKETAIIEYNHKSLVGEDSISTLDQVTSNYPSYVYGNYLHGLECVQHGDCEIALTSFRKALNCDYRDYRVWLGLGDCYSLKKEYEKAVVHYTQSLTLFPQCLTAVCRLAQSWIHLNNIAAAQKMISKGLLYDREYPGLLLLQAQVFKIKNQYSEAIEYYERVMRKCSLEVSVYIDIAQCYHELGNIPESKRVLFLASQVDDSNKEAVITLLKEYGFD